MFYVVPKDRSIIKNLASFEDLAAAVAGELAF